MQQQQLLQKKYMEQEAINRKLTVKKITQWEMNTGYYKWCH
jgi:hypothetical protein